MKQASSGETGSALGTRLTVSKTVHSPKEACHVLRRIRYPPAQHFQQRFSTATENSSSGRSGNFPGRSWRISSRRRLQLRLESASRRPAAMVFCLKSSARWPSRSRLRIPGVGSADPGRSTIGAEGAECDEGSQTRNNEPGGRCALNECRPHEEGKRRCGIIEKITLAYVLASWLAGYPPSPTMRATCSTRPRCNSYSDNTSNDGSTSAPPSFMASNSGDRSSSVAAEPAAGRDGI